MFYQERSNNALGLTLTFFYDKVKYGVKARTWKVLKIFAQESSSDDLWLTLTFYGMVKFAFWSLYMGRALRTCKPFGAKVNKYS